MSTPKYTVPPEFQSQLRYVDALDTRSDVEILNSLSKYSPVTNSEKNIWTFWHSGINGMHPWTRHNIIDWVRLNGPSWTVRVLDSEPKSENYALKYVDEKLLPEAFVQGKMDGETSGQHSADFLRGAALWQWGGVWIDVGCIAVRKIEDICWGLLGDDENPAEVCVANMYKWVYNRKPLRRFPQNSPFIKAWHDLFVHIWKNKTNASGFIDSPLLTSILANMKAGDAALNGFNWEWSAPPEKIMEYIGQIVAWPRICFLQEPGPSGFNGAEYYQKHVLPFSCLEEDWSAEALIGWKGQDLFDILATSTSADPSSEEYKRAYKVVWGILRGASMQKITHAQSLALYPHLGTLLDQNPDVDVREGTFLELLSYGSVHFEQVGREMRWQEAMKPPVEVVIKEPLLGWRE